MEDLTVKVYTELCFFLFRRSHRRCAGRDEAAAETTERRTDSKLRGIVV